VRTRNLSARLFMGSLVCILPITAAIGWGSPAGAASTPKVSIQMSIRTDELAGEFAPNDQLKLTVVVLVGGKPARSGDVDLTTNDPREPDLCGIIEPANSKKDYCNIDFPNRGKFVITARYEPVYIYPPHYTTTQTLVVRIRKYGSASPTTTTTTTLLPAVPTVQVSSVFEGFVGSSSTLPCNTTSFEASLGNVSCDEVLADLQANGFLAPVGNTVITWSGGGQTCSVTRNSVAPSGGCYMVFESPTQITVLFTFADGTTASASALIG
jgi:hypothetical protein